MQKIFFFKMAILNSSFNLRTLHVVSIGGWLQPATYVCLFQNDRKIEGSINNYQDIFTQ